MVRLGGMLVGVCVAAALAVVAGPGMGRVEAAGLAGAEDRTSLAAEQTAQNGSTPTLQVYSLETVVDVRVTDKDGKPVQGLTQADFTVKENGREQAIDSFAEFGGGDSAAGGSGRAEDTQGTFTNRGGVQVSGPVNVILLDGLNVPAGMLLRARRATVDYVKTMPQGTQIAIFALGEHGLERLSGFTSDRNVLATAATRWVNWGAGHVEGWTRQWVTTQALEQIAVYVKPVKGRKNLLWFTPQMPVLLLRDGGYGGGNGEMTVVHMLMDAFELLSGAQVAVSPIDPSGVTPMLGARQLMMEEVAEESGGTAYYNSNSLTAMLAKAVESGSHYYTLSYVPPRKKDDGRYHTIHVEVDRPGLKLAYRAGYNAEDPLSAKAIAPGPGLRQMVAKGTALAGAELVFDVAVQPGAAEVRPMLTAGKRATAEYSVVYSVPADEITSTADGKRPGTLRLEVEAFAESGKPVNVVAERVKVPPLFDARGDAVTTPFRYAQQLDLPEGKILLEVSVVDEGSRNEGRMEIPLTVAKGSGAVARR